MEDLDQLTLDLGVNRNDLLKDLIMDSILVTRTPLNSLLTPLFLADPP